MLMDDYGSLKEMLQEFRQESAKIDAEMDCNLRYIREVEAHLKAFTDLESDDFKVFSPRKAGTLYKEEIDKFQNEKSHYEECNEQLRHEKDIITSRIVRLEEILSHQNRDAALQEEAVRDLCDTVIQSLDEFVHKIELSSAYIESNPIQARQDFAVIGKCLKETSDRIRGTAGTR